MFNLEQSIAKWRQQMLGAGIRTPKPLNELEGHLREDIRVLVSAGEPEARAFELAVSRLGSPGSVQTEFDKIRSASIRPVKIASVLWLGVVIVLAALLSRGLFTRRWDFLLYVHVLSVTAGYSTAFLVGGLGVSYVCWRRFHKLSPIRQQSLVHAVYLFSHLALGSVIVGMVFALPVSKQLFGAYWRWDPKEIGGLCVTLWLIGLTVMQRPGLASTRGTMLSCIIGNIVVSLAWFGAGILDYHWHTHNSGTAYYLPLAVFLGMNLAFLVMGLVPSPFKAES